MSTATPFELREERAPETLPARAEPAHDRVPRVLVIRRRYLGDIVLLGSVLRNIRLRWPRAWIAVLTETAYAGVLGLNPDVDSALTFPHRKRQWLGFVRALRRTRFTHVLDFDNTEKTALVTDGQITLTFPASASQVVYCNWFSIPATSPAG